MDGWRCTSCGTTFGDGARCPKCLKQSSVVRHEPPKLPPAIIQEDEPPPPPTSRAYVLAALPSLIAVLLMADIGGFHVEPFIAIIACVGVAPIAGYLMTGERVYSTVAAMIAAVGVVFGAVFMGARVGMIIGFFPGLVLFFAFRRLAKQPVIRILLAFASLVAAAFVVTSC